MPWRRESSGVAAAGRSIAAVAAGVRLKSWTVAQYERMIDAGVLDEDDRVELVGEEIIEMAPVGSRHAATVKALARLFHQQVNDRCVVSVQDPIRLSERSQPQPDLRC
jgi:Uma2 family endonuclease